MAIKRRSLPAPDEAAAAPRKSHSSAANKKATKKTSKVSGPSSRLDDNQEDIIVAPFEKQAAKLLVARGVPYADLPSGPRLSVSDMLLRIEQKREGQPDKLISTTKQLKVLNAILANPLRGSYTLCISSMPSDMRAKALAAHIMWVAMNTQKGRSHAKPVWHRVYGSLGDPLRDKVQTETPSLLIISNIVEGSSALKIEKVRDLLEKYSSIPRIVVYGGADPLSLFTDKLHYPLKAGIFLGSGRKVQHI